MYISYVYYVSTLQYSCLPGIGMLVDIEQCIYFSYYLHTFCVVTIPVDLFALYIYTIQNYFTNRGEMYQCINAQMKLGNTKPQENMTKHKPYA